MTRSRDLGDNDNRQRAGFTVGGSGSWRIDEVTNTLECWGYVTGILPLGPTPVVLPKTYKTSDYVTTVTGTYNNNTYAALGAVQGASQTPTGFLLSNLAVESNGAIIWSGDSYFWRTIGEWDGIS